MTASPCRTQVERHPSFRLRCSNPSRDCDSRAPERVAHATSTVTGWQSQQSNMAVARTTLRQHLIAFFNQHPAVWHRPEDALNGVAHAPPGPNAVQLVRNMLNLLAKGTPPVLVKHSLRTGGRPRVWYCLAAQPPPGASPKSCAGARAPVCCLFVAHPRHAAPRSAARRRGRCPRARRRSGAASRSVATELLHRNGCLLPVCSLFVAHARHAAPPAGAYDAHELAGGAMQPPGEWSQSCWLHSTCCPLCVACLWLTHAPDALHSAARGRARRRRAHRPGDVAH